jgi:hypothetical protein
MQSTADTGSLRLSACATYPATITVLDTTFTGSDRKDAEIIFKEVSKLTTVAGMLEKVGMQQWEVISVPGADDQFKAKLHRLDQGGWEVESVEPYNGSGAVK